MQRLLLKQHNPTAAESRKSRRGSQFQSRPSDNNLLDSIQETSHHGFSSVDDLQVDVKYQVRDILLDLGYEDASTADVTPLSVSPSFSPVDVTPVSESPLFTPRMSRTTSLTRLRDLQMSTDILNLLPSSQSPFASPNVSRRPSFSLEDNDTTTNLDNTSCSTPAKNILGSRRGSQLQVIPIEHRVVKFKYQWGEYEGEMQGDVMQGKGLFKYGENDTYDGDWKDNRRHGRGVRRWPNGEEYVGDYVKGAKHGKGMLKYADGSVLYDGDWEFGRKEGKGKMRYPNGDVYEGEWIYGNRNGKGVFTFANGDVFDGHWNEDKRHGTGILDSSDGRSYRGEWVRDIMQGQFVYKFSNGSMYQGDVRQGKMHGKGLMKYANGLTDYDVYEGEFVDDKRNGFGTMTYAKGDVYRGEWKDDCFVSNGRSPSISHGNSRRTSLALFGQMVSQKLIDIDQNQGSRSPCISRRSSRNNLASIGQKLSQKQIDTDRNESSRSPCISRRSSRNTLDSALYDSVDLPLSRRNSVTHSQCSTPSHDYEYDMESNHIKYSSPMHAHSPNQGILAVDSTAEEAELNMSNMKGLLDSLDSKLSHCHSTAAALKNEQMAAVHHMKKKEKIYDFKDEKQMFALEYDVEELEDQKQVLEYTRRTSVSNADAIRALFEK